MLQHVINVLFTYQTLLIQQLGNFLVGARLQVTEGQILQLPFQLANAQPVGQRRVDIEDFLGHLALALRLRLLDRTDDHRSFRKLDQGDAHVVDHGHQHLAHVIQLPILLAQHGLAGGVERSTDRCHAQHAFDQVGHIRPEFLFHFQQRDLPFAHGPVKDSGGKNVTVGSQIHQHFAHFQADIQTAFAIGPHPARGLTGQLALFGALTGLFQQGTVTHRGAIFQLRDPVAPVNYGTF